MKRIIFIFLFATTLGLTHAQETIRMTLDSCLRYAYSHNLSVQTSELSRQSAEIALDGAKYKFAPSINASASESMSSRDGSSTFDNNLGLNASVTLFNGLSTINSYRQSKLQAEQGSLKVRQSENSISNQIIQTYLTILMNKERLEYQKEILSTAEQQREEGKVKYTIGKVLESDYKLLEASYQNALADIENTKLTIANNQLSLKSLLCFTDSGIIDVVKSSDSLKADAFSLPDMQEVIRLAYDTLPDLKIAQMNVAMAEYGVKIAKGSFSPNLSASVGANYYGGNSSVVNETGTLVTNSGINTSAVLSLNIPIFSRGSNLTQYKQSKISLQEAQLQYSQQLIDLQKEIEGQYISTQQALSKFKTSELMAEAYKANYDVYVLKYGAGAVTTVDMLTQQDRYLSALNDYLQNKYSFILDLKILDLYQGLEIKL